MSPRYVFWHVRNGTDVRGQANTSCGGRGRGRTLSTCPIERKLFLGRGFLRVVAFVSLAVDPLLLNAWRDREAQRFNHAWDSFRSLPVEADNLFEENSSALNPRKRDQESNELRETPNRLSDYCGLFAELEN